MGSVPLMFATHGLAADRIAQLGWALTLIGSAVSFVVVLCSIAWRSRDDARRWQR